MLKKLLKYEFMSTARIFVLCYAGVLAAAVLLRLSGALHYNNSDSFPMADLAAIISSLAYSGMVVSVIVVTFLFILQRFYKNLLGGEGYLMHTLPVTSRQLIFSKLIAAVTWTVLSGVVVVLSVFVLSMTSDLFSDMLSELHDMLRWYHASFSTPLILLALEAVLMVLAAIAASVLQIYAAIMIGQQASKHKIILSVAAYFGINIVLSIAGYYCLFELVFGIMPGSVLQALGQWLSGLSESPTLLMQLFMLLSIVFYLALSVLFFAVTEWIMRRRLNLE